MLIFAYVFTCVSQTHEAELGYKSFSGGMKKPC